MQRPDLRAPGDSLKERDLPGLFEAQAEQHPAAIAVCSQEQQVTYQEMNERANQVAHYLRCQGVRPGVRVGLCLVNSVEMAVGLLGILKAGGTCLPLDATSSSERLQYLLEDAQPRVLLTMRHVRDHLPEGGIPMLFLDADWEMIALQSRTNFRSPVIAANVACILYSSGSTRRPEGVMVSHYAITQRLWWVQSETPLTPADSVLPLASFWELFGSWLAGARVVLVDPARQFDSTYLIQFMARQRITVAHFVPSLLQRVVATPGLETCRDLRWIFCRGEVPVHLPQQLLSRLRVRFYQFYGPAEAAMRAAYWI